MSAEIEKLVAEAKRLPEADRILLAEQILATLDDGSDADAAEAWAREIEQRTREIEQGLVQPMPWPAAKHAAEQMAGERRRRRSPPCGD